MPAHPHRLPPSAPLATAIVLALLLPATLAVANVWAPTGPDGGSVTALLVDPGDPDVVYAGTASGVFRSLDGAATWTILPDSPNGFGTVFDLERGAGGALYAAEGGGLTQRSPDGGTTWIDVSIPQAETGGADQALTADPLLPGVVYAFSFQGIHKSTDDGASWQFLDSFPTIDLPGEPDPSVGVNDLTFDAAGTTIWASTNQGVYRSADGGASWQPASGGLAGDALQVGALAAVPGTPGALWAATAGGIYETANGGTSWTLVGPGPGFVPDLVPDPADPDRLWGRGPGMLEVSADGGVTWETVAGLPGVVLAIAPDPGGSGVVYAGTTVGPHRSSDGGETWQLATAGLSAHDVVDLDGRPDTGGRLLATTFDGRLYRSGDAGGTWTVVLSGPAGSSPREVETSADPSRVYARSARTVFRSLDGGVTWETASTFGSDEFLFGLWTDPDDPDVAFVAVRLLLPFSEDPTSVQRSDDGGVTWEPVAGGGIESSYELAFGAGGLAEPRTLLVSVSPGFFGATLLRSSDGGITFEETDRSGIDPFDRLVELAGDPHTPDRFLGWVPETGLVETVDAGDSWHPFGSGLPGVPFLDLLFDPIHPSTVYAAAGDEDVFRSLDRGATWWPLGTAPSDRLSGAFDLAVAGDPKRLFAGTDRGVWVAGPDTSPCAPDDVTLCLNGGRFEVRVGWQDFQGGSGPGHAVPLTGDTGAFWFFRDTNLELAVKLLDGRTVNGFWWVFYGSLSNVPFTLVLRDTDTGEERAYENPPRTFASRGDTRGFPLPAPALGAAVASASAGEVSTAGASAGGPAPPVATTAPGSSGGPCVPGDTVLCLNGGRFRVEVEWEDFQGGSGVGHTHPLTGDSGAFWFFRGSNLELFVKVLDGRAVNGRWWVFYGSLSNVPFTLTVTDTVTGTPKTYENPPRTFASRGDTTAF